MTTRISCGLILAIAIDAMIALTTPVRAESCQQPRYVLRLNQSAVVGDSLGRPLMNGAPFKVYEGEPIEWSHFAASEIDCEQNIENLDIVAGDVAAVFVAAPPEPAVSDLVPKDCADPVYLLVINTVSDAAKFETYITAVRKSGATSRHGLKRLFGGSPDTVLAGEWPDNTTAWLSQWPCFEAFESMYQSDLLQNGLLPMRSAAARYRLMVFRAADVGGK